MESKNRSVNQHTLNTARNLCDTYLRYSHTSLCTSIFFKPHRPGNRRTTRHRPETRPCAPPCDIVCGPLRAPAKSTHSRRRVAFCFAAPANIGGGGYI